ncbi:MAG: tRNA dihydrouridine synthase DusB [Bacilli bacterium]|nr:tRNA dihydrouridine synthase DusB [Bacilli bacterium]
MKEYNGFYIGNVYVKNPIIFAPMAGISDTSYRKIIKDMGAGLIYAEMVSDKAICFDNEKTMNMLAMDEKERPISQQIFGSDLDSFVKAAKIVEETMKPDILDINMGCPVPKVALKNQAGSALLKNPEKIREIVSAVVKAVNIPVTVKIRSGWDENSINAIEVAKIIEEAGASAIAIHARTRSQGYSGKANWDIIKDVVKAVNIPVIGNGDVTTPELAKQMLDNTGCSGVMIGRGAIGNPWLIKNSVDYLESGSYDDEPSVDEKINMMKKHLNMLIEDKNDHTAILEFRNHLMYYFRSLPNSKETKVKLCQAKTREEVFSILDEYKNSI